MPDYSAVACCEEKDTVQFTQNQDDASASVTLRVPWANRYLLVTDLMVNRRAWPHGSLGYPPLVSSCSIASGGGKCLADGQALVYADALVTANYSTREDVDLIAESLEPMTEFQKLDYRRFRWTNAAGDPLIEAEAPGRQLHSMMLRRTLFKQEPPLPTGLLTLPGSCNDDVYTSALLGLTFPAETLLFADPVLDRTITLNGDFSFTVTLMFPFKPDGWNKFWRAETETWERIWFTDAGAAYENYPLDDFSDFLF